MTNEELAARVKVREPGGMLELWEAVRRFVAVKAKDRARLPGCRVPLDDLMQAGFLAVVDAAEAYDPDRENGNFLELLKYTLKNHFAEEAGIRTSKRDALQHAANLDEPAKTDEGEADPAITCIEDEGAALAFMGVEYADFIKYTRNLINAALATLPEKQATILTAHYLKGKSMEESAKIAGISCKQSASCVVDRALYRLSHGRYTRDLRDCLEAFEDFRTYHSAAAGNRWRSTGISQTEAAALVR